MKLLSPDDYELAVPQLKEVTINNLFARSVVERHVDGKVYADDIAHPKSFYVVHPYGMSLLYGDAGDDFLQSELRDYLLARNGLRKTVEWLQIFPLELEKRIDTILGNNLITCDSDEYRNNPGYAVVKHQRINFKFNRQKFEQFRSTINPEAYSFCNVGTDLFNETNGSVVPKKFWNNAAEFTLHGVGFSLTVNGHAASIAFSAFKHDAMLELGMETKSEYRRSGFASIVSSRLIEYCFERGLEPVWSCREGNRGSYNLAVKLGFERTVSLPYYELSL